MKPLLIILLNILVVTVQSQVQISGTAISVRGTPVVGANIYIQASYDGATTDSTGQFNFLTDQAGQQLLIASFIGFETQTVELVITGNIDDVIIVFEEQSSVLNEVAINAGSFEASDEKKSVILKPMDIALTAGAIGDIFGAFGTLPGSHRVGEEGRLFVRGGESYETKTFMDGMRISTPFFSKMPDLPTRGRFSPLLFNGAVFSTGGYSAEYGQALSSIVALNTTALETENSASISLLSVGVQGSYARRFEKSSLALTGELLHTGLTNSVFNTNIQWINEPVITGSTLMFRQKTGETGMIKTFVNFSHNASRMMYNNFEESVVQEIDLKNSNVYFNTTYNEELNENWLIHSGLAFNFDSENTGLDQHNILGTKNYGQAKLSFTNLAVKNVTTKAGVDYNFYVYNQDIRMDGDFLFSFINHQYSAFAESKIKITKSLALRAGIRTEYNSHLSENTINPRLSAAVKTGKNSQLSAAFGTFSQNPEDEYLRFTSDLKTEKAQHSILTWQYKKGAQTIRLEAYNKKYSSLVKFREEWSAEPENYNNNGTGYSNGIDIFWRNQKEFGKSDYWISYAWNDSKRNYRDFPVQATPYYVSEHNISVVYKRFLTSINSFVSGSWSFASGRPYFNPNNHQFMSDRTKSYNDISLGLTHILNLFNTQAVIHLVVNNVAGFDNVFGYTYSTTKDDLGFYPSRPVTAAQKRMAVLLISFQL